MENENMNVSVHDVYSYLIVGARYGYTRNNHLEPQSHFYTTKKLIPQLDQANHTVALTTAKQLVEEAISIELYNLQDADDSYNNKAVTFKFINWLKDFIHKYDETWQPYNEDVLQQALQNEKAKVYNVYNITNPNSPICLTASGPVDKDSYIDVIIGHIKGIVETDNISYRKEIIDENKGQIVFHVTDPVKRDFLVQKI